MDLLTHFKSLNYGRVDDIINNLVFSLFELVKSLVINTEEERDWKVNTVFLLWRELMKATTTIFLHIGKIIGFSLKIWFILPFINVQSLLHTI